MFKGSIPALITPFNKDGEIDWVTYENFVEWQIEQGSHALVPCGTTGESPTLSHEEHNKVIERCIQVSAGRVPVIAGVGSNSTTEAIDLTKHAKDAGADAGLTITPYYNKPTQEGLYQHFKAISEAVDLPLIVYNVPGRCVVDLQVETVARVAALPNVIGIKDATGDLSRVQATSDLVGSDFCQLTGEDDNVIDFMKLGGHGVISVLANIVPKQCAEIHNLWQAGQQDEAEQMFETYKSLSQDLFCETSPSPAKYALNRLGKCENIVRLPLVPLSEQGQATVDAAMKKAGVL